MRRWVFVITVILLALCVVPLASAAATAEKGLRAMSGEISAIDATARTLTVRNDVAGSGVEEERFIVDSGATIRIHGLKGKGLGQLKTGDYVTVRYLDKDGKNVAMEIQHS